MRFASRKAVWGMRWHMIPPGRSVICRSAFTLVELLVVIGITALLIAILLPVLTAAREHAARAKCLSKLRQLTMAWLMYANEHQSRLCSSHIPFGDPTIGTPISFADGHALFWQ